MFEKVNPMHPDKIADRIAGAIVDLAYKVEENPKIAVEVLIGHETCHIIIESSCDIDRAEIGKAVHRIAGYIPIVNISVHKQDVHLANNQTDGFKCGDNGVFKGVPTTFEQRRLSLIARDIYKRFPTDGKYVIDYDKLIICQSHASHNEIAFWYPNATINPLGYWTGGINVDTGATNRKLGADMADGVTGGGLHGKDLSKADVSVNIYAFLKAQETGNIVNLCCAIGDTHIDGKPYSEIVEIAREYIKLVGGFEKFAEWGLV
jgi:S-adenosylmethionine synthetase